MEVAARCWRVPSEHRYEIELRAGDERAVVDIPDAQASMIDLRVQQALDAFRISLSIRSGALDA